MSSSPYPIRVPDELRELADSEDVNLSHAMRIGAQVYLSATPKEREAMDAAVDVKAARKSLESSVLRARSVLRSLD